LEELKILEMILKSKSPSLRRSERETTRAERSK